MLICPACGCVSVLRPPEDRVDTQLCLLVMCEGDTELAPGGRSLTTWPQELHQIHTVPTLLPKDERGLSRCPGGIKARSWPGAKATVRDMVPLKRPKGTGLRISMLVDSTSGHARGRSAEAGHPRSLLNEEQGAGASHPQLRVGKRMKPSPEPCSGKCRTSKWEAPWAWAVSTEISCRRQACSLHR